MDAPKSPFSNTHQTRLLIGYDGVREQWKEADITLTHDELQICGHPVMERWENGYMETLAHIATSRGGHILEIGYGMGISSSHIQKQAITKYTVIEANASVCKEAKKILEHSPIPYDIVWGFWEDVTKQFPDGNFDGILFDTYPLSAEEIHRNHFPFFSEAYRLLNPHGIFTYYSDEPIDFSSQHRTALNAAGFTLIEKIVCTVFPPADCKYWEHSTIVAPIIMK